ncbi:hypothetical protein KSS87_006746 [Heliosperma pusillum]|nr:hypothetical protein KSS87_006746 [Heliosperma pusillum]
MKLGRIAGWIGVLYITIYLEEVYGLENVNIGAILALGSANGKVGEIAMQAAVDDINSDASVLGGYNLSLEVYDTKYSGFLSLMGALQFMETDVVAVIGPQTSSMAHVLSHLANELHVPFLSFTALDPTLSPIQYPYFFQTAPNDLFQMTAIAEIVGYFQWNQVIAIYTDDEQSRNGITALGDKLSERRCRISYKAVLPPDLKNKSGMIEKELEKVKMMESRILVVQTLASYGPMILKAAQKLGMLGDGFVWIAGSWLPTILDSTPTPEIYKMSQGILTLQLHTPDSQRKRAFVARWNNLSNNSIGLNVYGLYAYDTVWLIAHALTTFLNHGNNISFSNDPILNVLGGGNLNLSAMSIFDGGNQLARDILETTMTGLTGPMWFTPERYIVDPSYNVINVLDNQMKQIGYWSNYSGLSVVAPEKLRIKQQNHSIASQKLNSVVWPGGLKKQPRGWVFPRDGRKLRIGVPRRVSFPYFVYQDNHTHVIQGYCIDVFEAAVKLLPYGVPYEFVLFGDGRQNPNYSELVRKVAIGDFDVAVGDIAIVTDRTRIVDFTQPYTDSGLVVVAPVKKLRSNAWAFLRPFTPFMWAVTAVFFLVVGVVIWILEHRLNDEFRGPPSDQFMTILWFSFSTLFFSHRYQVGSYAEKYLNEELNIPRSRLKPLKSPEEYADALRYGRVAAVVDEQPYVDLFLSRYCQFGVSGQEFTKSGWGFAFKRDSPLTLDMSTALLKLSENGKLQNITENWLKRKNSCKSQFATNDSDQLKIDNFIGLFLICGIACILSLIVYFSVMLYRFYQHLPPKSDPSITDSSHSVRLRTFLSFADKKEDASEKRLKRKRFSASMPIDGSESFEAGSRRTSSQRETIDIGGSNHSHKRSLNQ